jgi:hypothetical protein
MMGTIFVNRQKYAGYYSEINKKRRLNELFDHPISLIHSAKECPVNPIPFISNCQLIKPMRNNVNIKLRIHKY